MGEPGNNNAIVTVVVIVVIICVIVIIIACFGVRSYYWGNNSNLMSFNKKKTVKFKEPVVEKDVKKVDNLACINLTEAFDDGNKKCKKDDVKMLFPKVTSDEPNVLTYDKLKKAYSDNNVQYAKQTRYSSKLLANDNLQMGLMGRESTVKQRIDQINKDKMDGTEVCVQFNESSIMPGDIVG